MDKEKLKGGHFCPPLHVGTTLLRKPETLRSRGLRYCTPTASRASWEQSAGGRTVHPPEPTTFELVALAIRRKGTVLQSQHLLPPILAVGTKSSLTQCVKSSYVLLTSGCLIISLVYRCWLP